MECREEVESALLKENVEILVKEASHGKIRTDQMKRMALGMGGEVHGVFVAKKGEDLSCTLRWMLDKWYNEELYEPEVDGISKLIQILKDVGLKPLAHKMKQRPTEKQENTGVKNTSGDTDDIEMEDLTGHVLPKAANGGDAETEGGAYNTGLKNISAAAVAVVAIVAVVVTVVGKVGPSDNLGDSLDAGKTSFQKLEELVGDHNIQTILHHVTVGDFTKEEVEDFTSHLHPKVRGAFIRAKGEVSFVFNEKTMKSMLTNWYEKEAFKLTKKEAINKLKTALVKSDKANIASELKEK